MQFLQRNREIWNAGWCCIFLLQKRKCFIFVKKANKMKLCNTSSWSFIESLYYSLWFTYWGNNSMFRSLIWHSNKYPRLRSSSWSWKLPIPSVEALEQSRRSGFCGKCDEHLAQCGRILFSFPLLVCYDQGTLSGSNSINL